MTLSDPLQLISVLLIGAGIVLFDPQKIPETARALRRVRNEFDSARRSFQQVSTEVQGPARSGDVGTETLVGRLIKGSASSAPEEVSAVPRARSADEILLETAHELAISTPGKSREDISREILARIRETDQTRDEKGSPAPPSVCL